jgi:hypothetical protein
MENKKGEEHGDFSPSPFGRQIVFSWLECSLSQWLIK